MLITHMHVLLYILFNISFDHTTNSVIPFLNYVASFAKQNKCPPPKKKEKKMWMNIKVTAQLFSALISV